MWYIDSCTKSHASLLILFTVQIFNFILYTTNTDGFKFDWLLLSNFYVDIILSKWHLIRVANNLRVLLQTHVCVCMYICLCLCSSIHLDTNSVSHDNSNFVTLKIHLANPCYILLIFKCLTLIIVNIAENICSVNLEPGCKQKLTETYTCPGRNSNSPAGVLNWSWKSILWIQFQTWLALCKLCSPSVLHCILKIEKDIFTLDCFCNILM